MIPRGPPWPCAGVPTPGRPPMSFGRWKRGVASGPPARLAGCRAGKTARATGVTTSDPARIGVAGPAPRVRRRGRSVGAWVLLAFGRRPGGGVGVGRPSGRVAAALGRRSCLWVAPPGPPNATPSRRKTAHASAAWICWGGGGGGEPSRAPQTPRRKTSRRRRGGAREGASGGRLGRPSFSLCGRLFLVLGNEPAPCCRVAVRPPGEYGAGNALFFTVCSRSPQIPAPAAPLESAKSLPRREARGHAHGSSGLPLARMTGQQSAKRSEAAGSFRRRSAGRTWLTPGGGARFLAEPRLFPCSAFARDCPFHGVGACAGVPGRLGAREFSSVYILFGATFVKTIAKT